MSGAGRGRYASWPRRARRARCAAAATPPGTTRDEAGKVGIGHGIAQRGDGTHRRADEHDAVAAFACRVHGGGDIVLLVVAERRLAVGRPVAARVVGDDVELIGVQRLGERLDVRARADA